MKTYTGALLELGPSEPSGVWRRYAYIRIADNMLKNITADEKFSIALQDQIKREEEITIWVTRFCFSLRLIGVTQANNLVFRQETGGLITFMMIILLMPAVPTLLLPQVMAPLFGVAVLLSMWIGSFVFKIHRVRADHAHRWIHLEHPPH